MGAAYDSILSAIGHTPLVALSQCFPDAGFHLFGKVEATNPGGSAKDRAAYSMIKNALETGALKPGGTVVESSSGNMAIGLAQACCRLRLRFISVVDAKTPKNIREILRAYGAEVITVSEPDPASGEFLPARLDLVQRLLRDAPHSFWPNQYANEYNAQAHRQTMHEVVEALARQVDYLVCPTSTCGTIRGCYEYVRQHRLKVKLVAVDALGSVIFGGQPHHRLLPGHGSVVRPDLASGLQVDRVVYVDDADCAAGCRYLVGREGILAGASSGGAIAAIAKIHMEIAPR